MTKGSCQSHAALEFPIVDSEKRGYKINTDLILSSCRDSTIGDCSIKNRIKNFFVDLIRTRQFPVNSPIDHDEYDALEAFSMCNGETEK